MEEMERKGWRSTCIFDAQAARKLAGSSHTLCGSPMNALWPALQAAALRRPRTRAGRCCRRRPSLAACLNAAGERAATDASLHSSSADPCATPHSGYHCDGSVRRFFEGWYFRITLPGHIAASAAPSFAWMYSVEEPVLRGCVGRELSRAKAVV